MESAPAGHLKRLGFAQRTFELDQVTELTQATRGLVYLLPLQAMDAKPWARLRVQFAQANRPYLLWVEKCTTADVARGMRDGAHDVSPAQIAGPKGEAIPSFCRSGRSLEPSVMSRRSMPVLKS